MQIDELHEMKLANTPGGRGVAAAVRVPFCKAATSPGGPSSVQVPPELRVNGARHSG
jgi:hypothetical protein